MRTSVSVTPLITMLIAVLSLGAAASAAEPGSATSKGATVRESQDSRLANANANADANADAGRQAVHAAPAQAAGQTGAGGYVPKTKYDNTPYRYNAGTKFTAAEFDAWMKSRGIRVAKGAPPAAPVPAGTGTAAATAAALGGGAAKEACRADADTAGC